MNSRVLRGLAQGGIVLLLWCAGATGQVANLAATPAAGKSCTPVTDPASPLRRAIAMQYGRIGKAIKAHDFPALEALHSDNLHVLAPNGQSWNREQALAYQRNALEQSRDTRRVTNTIIDFLDCGDRAVATVLQQWSRTEILAGRIRWVETSAVQDETWTRSRAGWLRAKIENERPGASYVDGRRVDTTRPYDPDAPEYDPLHQPRR